MNKPIRIPAHAAPMTPGQEVTEYAGDFEVNIQRSETATATFRVWVSRGRRLVEGREVVLDTQHDGLIAVARARRWALENSAVTA